MSRRRAETPIAKPQIVIENAFGDAVRLFGLGWQWDKAEKIGDVLARLDAGEGAAIWRSFTSNVKKKFDDKSFSRSLFWIACLKHNLSPLHVIAEITKLHGIYSLGQRKQYFSVYRDVHPDIEDKTKAFEKLDKLFGLAIDFVPPYNNLPWAPKECSLRDYAEFTIVADLNDFRSSAFMSFVRHSAHANKFCISHCNRIVEFATTAELSSLLQRLIDSIPAAFLENNGSPRSDANIKAGMKIFEDTIEQLDGVDQIKCFDINPFSPACGNFVESNYKNPIELAPIAASLAKLGVCGVNISIARKLIEDPERFMMFVEPLGSECAVEIFSHAANAASRKDPIGKTLNLIKDFNHRYQQAGLGTLTSLRGLVGFSSDYEIMREIHQLDPVSFMDLANLKNDLIKSFCSQSRVDANFLNTRDKVFDYVDFLKEVGAAECLSFACEEYLTKNQTPSHMREMSLKDFFEAVLLSKSLDPNELLKTPRRIEKLIALGVSPKALSQSEYYTSKWKKTSLESDLGI